MLGMQSLVVRLLISCLSSSRIPNISYQGSGPADVSGNVKDSGSAEMPETAPSFELHAIEWNLKNGSQDRIRAAGEWLRIIEPASKAPYVMNGPDARGYWVVRLPGKIIAGHDGIFDKAVLEFISGLYRICRPDKHASQTLKMSLPRNAEALRQEKHLR